MLFAFALGIDKNVIKVHYYKNIELFCQDLIDIALEYGQCIGQSKKHYLVFEMAITSPESHFLFITFPNPHLMVGIDQIELGKTSSPI